MRGDASPDHEEAAIKPLARCLTGLLLGSLLWSLALTLIFAPGLSSNDSAQRAWMMTSVVEAGKPSTYTTPRLVFEHVFPPMMTLVGATLREVWGGWALHTFLQAFWLFGSFGVVATLLLGPRRGILLWLVFCAVPIVWNHAVAMLPDATVTAALLTMFCVLLWPAQPHRRFLLLRCTILFFCGAFAFGYRFNTLTALLLGLLPFTTTWSRRGVACAAAALVLSAGVGPLLQKLVPYRDSDVVSPMLAWEHVGTLRLTGDADERARHSLDAILGKEGETARAVSVHTWDSMVPTCFTPDAPLPAGLLRQPHVGAQVRAAFIALLRDKPVLYARSKLRVWKMVMGVGNPPGLYWIGTTPPAWIKDRGIDLSPTAPTPLAGLRVPLSDWGERMTARTRTLWTPWLWCLLTTALGATCLLARRRISASAQAAALSRHASLLWLTGLSYFGAFLIISGSHEWRYYFPAFALHVLSAAVWLVALISVLRATPTDRRTAS